MWFINNWVHNLMTGMLCTFILTKLLDLPLYYFHIFSHTYICVVIDSLVDDRYHEIFGYCGRLDPGDAWEFIARLGECSW